MISTPLSRNSTQKICPRLEVSIVQHSSNGFLLGLWNLGGRAKEKKLSPDVQLEETKIVQILYAPSTTRKNETGKQIQSWKMYHLVRSDDGLWEPTCPTFFWLCSCLMMVLYRGIIPESRIFLQLKTSTQLIGKMGCTLKLARIHSNVCKVFGTWNFQRRVCGPSKIPPLLALWEQFHICPRVVSKVKPQGPKPGF